MGRRSGLEVWLDPYEPALFALSDRALPQMSLHAAKVARRGESFRIAVSTPHSTFAAQVYRVEVRNPSGDVMAHYSGNLLAPDGNAAMTIPFAVSDPTGRWLIRVRDVASGASAETAVAVE